MQIWSESRTIRKLSKVEEIKIAYMGAAILDISCDLMTL